MKATHTINPDDYKKMPVIEVMTLDPNKPYVVRVPSDAPDDYIRTLVKDLSAMGIFAIVIHSDIKFYSSFPIDIKLTKREMEVPIDVEPTPEAPKPTRKTTKKSTTKKKSTTIRKAKSKSQPEVDNEVGIHGEQTYGV